MKAKAKHERQDERQKDKRFGQFWPALFLCYVASVL